MMLNEKIIAARKLKGLTQEQLAELTGVTVRTIQRIEKGETVPRSYTLKNIATTLGISLDDSHEQSNHITESSFRTEEDVRHFLQMLSLSCFAYLVIPWVHFLLPYFLLKKKRGLPLNVQIFARKVIRLQIQWVILLNLSLLLLVMYNFLAELNFRQYVIPYFWILIFFYLSNVCLILSCLLKIPRLELSKKSGE